MVYGVNVNLEHGETIMNKARLIPSLCERIVRHYATNPSSLICKENEEFLEDIESKGRLWGYLMNSDPEYFYEDKNTSALYAAANTLLESFENGTSDEQGLLDNFGMALIRTYEDIEGLVHRDAWMNAEEAIARMGDNFPEENTYSAQMIRYFGRTM